MQLIRFIVTNHMNKRLEQRTRAFRFPVGGETMRLLYCGERGWAWHNRDGVVMGEVFPQSDGSAAFVAKTILTTKQFDSVVSPARTGHPLCWREYTVREIAHMDSAKEEGLQLKKTLPAPENWSKCSSLNCSMLTFSSSTLITG